MSLTPLPRTVSLILSIILLWPVHDGCVTVNSIERDNMAEASSSMSGKAPANETHITEGEYEICYIEPSAADSLDEASLYDRQIRLWGLEAQNRMRSSTVLVLSLRSLAHETIKNLVLAGIGRLIVMDDGVVTEEDLGGGFLFREEEGAVGREVSNDTLPTSQKLTIRGRQLQHLRSPL